ncbi:MAG TPA: ATP-binding protein [Pyrinomonadaceae bacterium]
MKRRGFLTYLLLCLVPLLALAALNYWNGLRAVDQTIGETAQRDLNSLTADVDTRVQQQEAEIRRLASSQSVRDFLAFGETEKQKSSDQPPASLAADFASALGRNGSLFRLALFDKYRVLQLQAERPVAADAGVMIRTKDFRPQTFPPDVRQGQEFSQVANTSVWRYASPVSGANNEASSSVLVGELDLSEIFLDRVAGFATSSGSGAKETLIVAWDKSERILHHTQRSLDGQLLRNALPQLADMSSMSGIHRLQVDNGDDYIVAMAPLPRLNISVAVGRDRSSAVASAHRWGIAGLLVALALALMMAFLVDWLVRQRSTGIVRVNEALGAVARGQLDQRVDLHSSDDAHSMADNLNILAERMRAQYVREAEARQFESFFRLSAMLTHDLKNAIEALSLIVSNMERHFHNEQFRVDAMKSLTSATNKLRALVARLSRPVTSLSGEHKMPRRTDIAPVLQRAVRETAEPAASRHTLDVKLPSELFAVVDVDHIHEVFENLILNALESMTEKRGTLTVAAEKTPEGKAVITVSDTGCGMSKTFLEENLFRPFRTTKKAGVGLGLYTCREVVVASGGTIEADSVEGVGTTFRVVLPSDAG